MPDQIDDPKTSWERNTLEPALARFPERKTHFATSIYFLV